ncbi:MAG: hypothetical protein II821_00375 [Treponema sp.]|nr:hypothetical protein [Treponema sp.]
MICRGVQRDSERAKRLMKSYSRHQGTQTAYTVLRDDILTNDAESLTEDTVYAYTNASWCLQEPGSLHTRGKTGFMSCRSGA